LTIRNIAITNSCDKSRDDAPALISPHTEEAL